MGFNCLEPQILIAKNAKNSESFFVKNVVFKLFGCIMLLL